MGILEEEFDKWLWLEEQLSALKGRVRKLEEFLLMEKAEKKVEKLDKRITNLERRYGRLLAQMNQVSGILRGLCERAKDYRKLVRRETPLERSWLEVREDLFKLIDFLLPPVILRCPSCGSSAKVVSIPWEAHIQCDKCGHLVFNPPSEEWRKLVDQHLIVMEAFLRERIPGK